MRKRISAIYSKAFPKKGGGEYTGKELLLLLIGWTVVFALGFLILKYGYDRFHLK